MLVVSAVPVLVAVTAAVVVVGSAVEPFGKQQQLDLHKGRDLL